MSYETVRRWALKFGGIIARKLRRGRPRPDGRWHLDDVFVSINGRQLYIAYILSLKGRDPRGSLTPAPRAGLDLGQPSSRGPASGRVE